MKPMRTWHYDATHLVYVVVCEILHRPSLVDAGSIEENGRLYTGGPNAHETGSQRLGVSNIAFEALEAAAKYRHHFLETGSSWVIRKLDGYNICSRFRQCGA